MLKPISFRLAPASADLESQEYAGLHETMNTFIGRGDKSS